MSKHVVREPDMRFTRVNDTYSEATLETYMALWRP